MQRIDADWPQEKVSEPMESHFSEVGLECVPRDYEFAVLSVVDGNVQTTLALLAPESSWGYSPGKILIEWCIDDTTSERKRLRKLARQEIVRRFTSSIDDLIWIDFVLDAQRLPEPTPLVWEIINPAPIAPRRAEWDFKMVPDSEIIACCLWEYGRESHTLSLAVDCSWLGSHDVQRKQRPAQDSKQEEWERKERERIEERVSYFGFDYNAFLEGLWQTDLALLEIYDLIRAHGGSESFSWLFLPPDFRELVIQKVGESSILMPLKVSTIGELETVWNDQNQRLLQIRCENRPEDDDSEEMELYSETQSLQLPAEGGKHPELTVAAFTIDFSRFTDGEITTAFQKWLKSTRPLHWQKPRRIFPNSPRRGQKLTDYRIALERLGLMRLLNQNYPEELRRKYPTIWKRMCRDETHFRRECQFSCDFFRALFPFLPPDEKPNSSTPCEVWEPLADAASKEYETELLREKNRD